MDISILKTINKGARLERGGRVQDLQSSTAGPQSLECAEGAAEKQDHKDLEIHRYYVHSEMFTKRCLKPKSNKALGFLSDLKRTCSGTVARALLKAKLT